MRPLTSETFPLTGNRLIEASAGTGKTYTITNLYLRLLLGQGEQNTPLPVSKILVLTFTIAATEELRGRIRNRIVQARRAFVSGSDEDDFLQHLVNNSADVERDTRLLAASLQLMDEASIFTIHGFCARVLADNAFETGTLFDQHLDADRDALLELASEDCFRSLILTLPPHLKSVALNIWDSPARLQEKTRSFLFRYNLSLLPAYREVDLQALQARIIRAKQLWLAEDFPAVIKAAGINGSTNIVRKLGAMTQWCGEDDLDTDLWQFWTSETLANAKLNKNGYCPEHPLIDLIDQIVSDLDQLPFNLWHRVIAHMTESLDRYKADMAQLTLDDLLAKVNQALQQDEGRWLAPRLAERWPVAMIDEFQDTDDIQYEIFQRIYTRSGDHSLFFIGDPKQAIYQFRGADVFTYINARRAIDPEQDVFSLTTNWRSSTPLISAVNTLFDQPDIFDNDADIPFEPVQPSSVSAKREFIDTQGSNKPVSLFQLVESGDAKLTADKARRLAMGYAAEETARLLSASAAGNVLIDKKPLHAGQIAFLVRNRTDAKAAREALADRHIRSVYVTLESVFLSDTADDLKLILQAVLEPTNERALRAALAVPLMQSTAEEIDELSKEVTAQQRLLEEFQHYHQLWSKLDVATMIEALSQRRHIARKWFGHPDGERQITNLRHLTELLQQRAAIAPGMHRLLKWYTREKLDAESVASEERQLRLESDRDLVQIVTMHASKGLEYDIVMIPMASFTAPNASRSSPYLFHDTSNGRFRAYLDFSNNTDHKDLAISEQLAEDMRLLYVAITRAKHKCYIGLANTGSLKQAAITRLLKLDDLASPAIEAQLASWLPESLFDIATVVNVDITPWIAPGSRSQLRPPPEAPDTVTDWRMHSYTGIARQIKLTDEATAVEANIQPGFADDEIETSAATGTQFDRFHFPRGPRAGIALHSLLEELDFTASLAEQRDLFERCVDRTGIIDNRDEWIGVLQVWTADILATPFADGGRLADIDRARRLDELEFHFPLQTDARLMGLLKSAGYLEPGAQLVVETLHGMMTGLIDLVFEFNGKFWLVDYKSNHLGDTLENYAHAPLSDAVKHHQYDLQYLLYCVALNRYLRSRLPGYQYERDFGGVCYLFLRGMTGVDAATGVYFEKPDEAFLDRLDAMLEGSR